MERRLFQREGLKSKDLVPKIARPGKQVQHGKAFYIRLRYSYMCKSWLWKLANAHKVENGITRSCRPSAQSQWFCVVKGK